jgi:uncharacterized protein (DUF488 family)
MIQLFTIGYTHKSAEKFFSILAANNIKNVIDIRLNNNSQLAGFTKKNDLEYFLKNILGINYFYLPFLAPTDDILKSYKKKEIGWNEYELQFNSLMNKRKIEDKIDIKILQNGCLLCSEEYADNCHRRLVAEYLKDKFKEIVITHI